MRKKKIGLLGCSKICIPAIINAVKQMECAEVYGCAARDYGRAMEYAAKYNITHAFKDYRELLECSDIDIVYISLANSLHYQWAMEAMKYKKHVLLEKPMCMSYREALEIEKMKEIDNWLSQYRKIWETRFNQLDNVLSTIKKQKK